jgi:hypothetical protein
MTQKKLPWNAVARSPDLVERLGRDRQIGRLELEADQRKLLLKANQVKKATKEKLAHAKCDYCAGEIDDMIQALKKTVDGRKSNWLTAHATRKFLAKTLFKGLQDSIFHCRVTLKGTRPPIWRLIQVRDCPLSVFGKLINAAMGWDGPPFDRFILDGTTYGVRPPSTIAGDMFAGSFLRVDRSSKSLRLSDIALDHGIPCDFLLDCGPCGWEHAVTIESARGPEVARNYPFCERGKGACPPSSLDSPTLYKEFLKALKGSQKKFGRLDLNWYRKNFLPDLFDESAASKAMQKLK